MKTDDFDLSFEDDFETKEIESLKESIPNQITLTKLRTIYHTLDDQLPTKEQCLSLESELVEAVPAKGYSNDGSGSNRNLIKKQIYQVAFNPVNYLDSYTELLRDMGTKVRDLLNIFYLSKEKFGSKIPEDIATIKIYNTEIDLRATSILEFATNPDILKLNELDAPITTIKLKSKGSQFQFALLNNLAKVNMLTYEKDDTYTKFSPVDPAKLTVLDVIKLLLNYENIIAALEKSMADTRTHISKMTTIYDSTFYRYVFIARINVPIIKAYIAILNDEASIIALNEVVKVLDLLTQEQN